MEAASAEPNAAPPVLFGRPGKKRKIYRQRHEADGDSVPKTDASEKTPVVSPQPDAAEGAVQRLQRGGEGADHSDKESPESEGGGADDDNDDDDDDDGRSGSDSRAGLTVAELVRRRKARRPRLRGMEFRGGDATRQAALAESLDRFDEFDLDSLDIELAGPIDMGLRFAPQTGLIGDVVNKHMEEFVEAEMAKRYNATASTAGLGYAGQHGASESGGGGGPLSLDSKEVREQLAMKGKLHEIDLGAESRARNIAMTERATRRLHSSDATDTGADEAGSTEAVQSSRPGKRALGANGRRGRRDRRGSDDIKRDQMVEQFLHENKMDVDVYDVSREAAPPSMEGRPADDRVAEQFRREFMEALAQRLRRKRRPLGPPAKPKVRNEEEILRGPKLGGSRNVRSMMRDKLLQKQEEERQTMPKYKQQMEEERRRLNRRR